MCIKNKKQIRFKRFLGILTSLFAIFILFWQSGRASEESSPSITSIAESDSTDDENKKKLDELERRARLYREIIEVKRKQQDSLSDELSVMDTQMERINTEIELNQRKITEFDQKIKDLQNQITEKEKTLELQKIILAQLLATYYQISQQNILNVVFTDADFASFMSRKDQLAQAGGRIKEMTDSVTAIRKKLIEERSELDAKRLEIVNAHYDLADKNAVLEETQNKKKTLLEQTKGEEDRYQQLLIKTREQIQKEIERIELEKSGVDLGPLPPSKTGFFIYPVNPVVITQNYGKTNFSNNYASGLHNGIDFSVNYKSVYAVGNGTVLQVGDNGKYAYGKWIAISHGNGLVTLYGHFSRVVADKGDKVKAGDVIGISGDTGFSTGPHLHFTVFAEKTFELVESKIVSGLMLPTGVSINPKNYL